MSRVTLGVNISSLKAQSKLAETSSRLSTVFERLSSGQRINRASDDAAGLAVFTSLEGDRRVFQQGIRNLNDGISLLNVADSAIEQLTGIVVRLKELAEQAANGVYGTQQRKSLDAEAQALSREYFRLARSTEYNGRGLFHAEFGELRLQGGYGESGGIQSALGGAIGTGSFGSANSMNFGIASTNDVEFSDLNGDGFLDLVTTQSSNLVVNLGQGNGSFGSSMTFATLEVAAIDFALGDINGDGIIDAVTAGFDGGTGESVSVFIGRGDGTFGAPASYDDGSTSNHNGVVLADVSGDGALDIVTSGSNGYAWVFVGTGSGTFGTGVSHLMLSTSGAAISVGDVNSDGLLDMVMGGVNGGGGSVSIRLGTGGGNFGSATVISMDPTTTSGVTLGDLNGDGLLDIVTAGSNGAASSATVRLGTGGGSFGGTTVYAAAGGTGAFEPAIGDFNGDGFLDFVTAGGVTGGVATVFLGSGNGTFSAGVSYGMQSASSLDIAVADLNNDGVMDFATVGSNGGTSGVTTRFGSTASGISPLLPFLLTSRAEALQALSQFTHSLDRLTAQRGTIGAFQSRIAVAASALQSTADNYAEAAGRIMNADIAEETSNLVRLRVLQQAASAILAQANQQPAIALRLLGDAE